MKRSLRSEFYKMIGSRLLWVSLLLGILCAVSSAAYMWKLYDSNLGSGGILAWGRSQGYAPKENYLVMMPLFSSWMNAEAQSVGAKSFFLLTPVIASLPCGCLFYEEIHSGYLRMILPRIGKNCYFTTKILVSFVTGGCLLILPQIFNFWLLSLHIPGIKPNVIYSLYADVGYGELFSGVFYENPFSYVFLILLINFLFGGIFALLSLAAAFLVKSHLAAIVVPFVFLLVVDSCRNFQYYISYLEISPLHFLHPITAVNFVQLPVVILWAFLLCMLTISWILVKGGKLEIL